MGTVKNITNVKQIAERIFQLAIRSHALDRKDWCDLYIEPEGVDEYGFLQISNAKKIFELGYNAGRKRLEEIGWG